MRDFADRLAPAGFDARALLPSYGMAEATLAITFHPRGTPIVTDTVDPEAMKRGEALPVPPGTPGALELVACGVPFPAHGLRIVERAADPGEHGLEAIGLGDGAGKPVEDEAARRIRARQPLANHAENGGIVHQLAGIHHRFGHEAQRGTVPDMGPEQIPG